MSVQKPTAATTQETLTGVPLPPQGGDSMGLLPPLPLGPTSPPDSPLAEKPLSGVASPRVDRPGDYAMLSWCRGSLHDTVLEDGRCLVCNAVMPPREPGENKTVWCEGSGKTMECHHWGSPRCNYTCRTCGAVIPVEVWQSKDFAHVAPPHFSGQETWPELVTGQTAEPDDTRASRIALLDEFEKAGLTTAAMLERELPTGMPLTEALYRAGRAVAPGLDRPRKSIGTLAMSGRQAPVRFFREPWSAGVGVQTRGDAPHVDQLLPDVPPWPELDAGPPGSCPGVGKPLVRRYAPPSLPSCSGCEMAWGIDTEVAPEHERSNFLTDQRLRRLDAWAQAAGGLLGQLRRRVLEHVGRDQGVEEGLLRLRAMNDVVKTAVTQVERGLGTLLGAPGKVGIIAKLSDRVADVESRLAAQSAASGELAANLRALENHVLDRMATVEGMQKTWTEFCQRVADRVKALERRADGAADRVTDLENRTSGLHEPAKRISEIGRRLSDLERDATDTQARPGFVRWHLGKAIRHLAALVEDSQRPAPSWTPSPPGTRTDPKDKP